MQTKRILCVSFSPIHSDSRVLRQLKVLAQHGEVTTVGYGPTPHGSTLHIEVPENASSLPETPLGVAKLAFRLHKSVELKAPGEKAVLKQVVGSGPYDLVVANDARALPLAFTAAGNAPVMADMHEWAPAERAAILVWRLLVGPYFDALCRKYLPRAAAVTSVGAGIAGLYRERYGVHPEIVRNAAAFQNLSPTTVDPDTIRLVHSGIADDQRNILELIEAVGILGERFTLDLYLVEVPGGHIDVIRNLAASTSGVKLHPPVPPETLPHVLNQYDLGVFLLPLKTLSKRYHLPNKFFDFVQARLGLVFSPAPEIDALITKYQLGITTSDTTAQALVDALRNITVAEVSRYKAAADSSAKALSSEPDNVAQSALVARLLAGHK